MLTVSDMSRITKEIILGMPPSNTSAEAEDFRKKVAEEITEMRAQGVVPELPYDFD
jgi:hypothetical protein